MNITNEMINEFEKELRKEEKSPATVEKYIRDVKAFCEFVAAEDGQNCEENTADIPAENRRPSGELSAVRLTEGKAPLAGGGHRPLRKQS